MAQLPDKRQEEAPVKVLFVCLGNSCRSPMAEAVARRQAADVIEASSAGLTPLGHVATLTKQTLASNGYEGENLESKPLMPSLWEADELVINMTGRSRESLFRDWRKVEDWDVEDPYGADPESYQRILEDIEGRVRELAERLIRNGSKGS